jgi:hypothetical protein
MALGGEKDLENFLQEGKKLVGGNMSDGHL